MEHSKEAILQALEVIKDTCKNHPDSSCNTCPFEQHGECYIGQTYPCEWEINKPNKPWRALI